ASNSFIGWAMWAAGAFKPDYPLVLTVADASEPTGWKDQPNWISVKNLLPKAGSTKAPGTTTPPSKPSHKSSKGAKRAIGDGCQTRKRLRRMMMKT
ncbi:hypothetical protein O181_084078, partial [Austropuccinia psidii MF-1]|nr:hypothetical protein [Austropuccinia psidii MF-1]